MLTNITKRELKSGKPEAYEQVFRLLYPRLKGYCGLFISSKHEIEDIIQECFITLWDKRKSIRLEESVESLLFVMIRNRCLNVLKKSKLHNGNTQLENLNIAELQYLYQLDFMEREEKSLEELMIESFKKAVDELPLKMRVAFKKCKIEGQKQKVVAEEMGVSVKMVEKHILKAKSHIRKKLIKQYPMFVILISLLMN